MQDMEQDKDIGCMAIFLWLVILVILCATCSCTTTRLRTEVITVHDTLRMSHTDTIHDVKVIQLSDTLKEREVHTFTLNNVGDTIREVHHYNNIERLIIVDSTLRYKASRDSLSRLLDKEREKEKVIQDNYGLFRQKIYFAVLIIVMLGMIAKFGLKRKG